MEKIIKLGENGANIKKRLLLWPAQLTKGDVIPLEDGRKFKVTYTGTEWIDDIDYGGMNRDYCEGFITEEEIFIKTEEDDKKRKIEREKNIVYRKQLVENDKDIKVIKVDEPLTIKLEELKDIKWVHIKALDNGFLFREMILPDGRTISQNWNHPILKGNTEIAALSYEMGEGGGYLIHLPSSGSMYGVDFTEWDGVTGLTEEDYVAIHGKYWAKLDEELEVNEEDPFDEQNTVEYIKNHFRQAGEDTKVIINEKNFEIFMKTYHFRLKNEKLKKWVEKKFFTRDKFYSWNLIEKM